MTSKKTFILIHHGEKQGGEDPALTHDGVTGTFNLASKIRAAAPGLSEVRHGVERRVKQTAGLLKSSYGQRSLDNDSLPVLIHDESVQDGKPLDVAALSDDLDEVAVVVNSYHIAMIATQFEALKAKCDADVIFPEVLIFEAEADSWDDILSGRVASHVTAYAMDFDVGYDPENFIEFELDLPAQSASQRPLSPSAPC